MVHFVVGDDALGFVVVFTAGIEVAVELGKIAAADFDAQLVSGRDVDAGLHGLERDFVDFAFFHPHRRLGIAFAIAGTLDILFDVVGRAVGQYFDELHSKVRVFGVTRHIKHNVDGAADLDSFLERTCAVNEDIVARFETALIDRAGLVLRAQTAKASPVGGNRVHRIVDKSVGAVFGLRRGEKGSISVNGIGVSSAGQVIRHGLGALGRPGVRRLPLVAAHGVIADLRSFGENPVVLAFEEVVKPSVTKRVVVEACVAHVAFADNGVLGSAFVTAMGNRRDDRVLLGGCRGAGRA